MALPKKILFAGGSHADIPQILEAKKRQLQVFTVGNSKKDKGHSFADKNFFLDYSDKNKILELAKKLKIDFIISSANDFSHLTASYVASELNLPGYDPINTNEIIHYKDKFKSFCEKNNLPVAKQYNESKINELSEKDFPIITKPTDLTGGKGMSISSNTNELKKSIEFARKASRSKKIVIEKFINGSNHAMCSIVKNGRIEFYFFDNEHYYLNNFLVSGASSHSIIPHKIQLKILNDIKKIISILSLVDGILHLQFKFNNGEYYFLEICRRPPGDLYTKFVTLATGVNLPLIILNSFTDYDYPTSELRRNQKEKFVLRHCLMSNQSGKIDNIYFDNEIKKNITEKFDFLNSGDQISDHMTEKLSIFFLEFSSKQEMDKNISLINEKIIINFR